MATYNCADTLKRSIDSILHQTFTDWEFIICDDCSTDSTLDILNDYASHYPQQIIVLRNEKNSKLAFSLNHCLSHCGGEYIARMDGDDESLPERLETQVSYLDNHPEISVVGTAMQTFSEKGDGVVRYTKEYPNERDLVFSSPFCHATIMMRKSAYDAVGGYVVSKRTERAQDYDMWFRFFKCGLKGYNLQLPLYRVLEDASAFRRRTLKSRCYEVVTKLKGYRLLNYPFYTYIFALKPVLAYFRTLFR